MIYCNECRYFTDQGRCKNPASKRSDVGYFQAACKEYEPMEKEKILLNEDKVPVDWEPKKVCKICGRELPEGHFVRGRWGLLDICSDCMKEKRKKRGKGDYKTPVNPQAELKPTPLSIYTDTNLIEELGRRGWSGKLQKTLEINL